MNDSYELLMVNYELWALNRERFHIHNHNH